MPKDDKKEYRDVLATLNGAFTATQAINRLVKVEVATEDEKLKKALGIVVGRLKAQQRIAPEDLKKVKAYCDACIASAKPQWQILAERNGWAPKA